MDNGIRPIGIDIFASPPPDLCIFSPRVFCLCLSGALRRETGDSERTTGIEETDPVRLRFSCPAEQRFHPDRLPGQNLPADGAPRRRGQVCSPAELSFSTRATSTYNTDGTRTRASTQDGLFATTLNLPTGGSVIFSWDNPATKADIGQDYGYSSGWSVQFIQPLLKNAGVDVATQSIRQARVAEEQYILDLKDTLATTITTTITDYRAYVSALRSYDIQAKGLETARRTLETNQALIDAGRMAQTEILQAENDVANRELSVITARNDVDSARLTLLQILNLDKNTNFLPVEEGEQFVPPPSLEEAIAVALKTVPITSSPCKTWSWPNWTWPSTSETFSGISRW